MPKSAIFLLKGTGRDYVAYFDNSTKNKFNPDPTRVIHCGEQIWEEMMIGWYTYVKATPASTLTAEAFSAQ